MCIISFHLISKQSNEKQKLRKRRRKFCRGSCRQIRNEVPFLRSGSRNDVIYFHLVYEVFLLHLGTLDQNGVEFFAMPNSSQDATFVLTNTLPDVFPLQTAVALRAAARRSRRHDSFDMSSLVVPLLEQPAVVPSESHQKETCHSDDGLHDTVQPLDLVQKHHNIARGVIGVALLCLRLGMRTVTQALHAQPDRRARGASDAGGAVLVEGVVAELDEAGRFDGTDTDSGSGISALLSSRLSANRTLFNARPVGASPTRLAAARRWAFSSSVFLISPRHDFDIPRSPLTNALQPGQRSDVPCKRCAAGLTSSRVPLQHEN